MTSALIGEVNRLIKSYGLSPVFFKQIFMARCRGLSNIAIAEHTGINKNTVNKYVATLRKMSQSDVLFLTVALALSEQGQVNLSC